MLETQMPFEVAEFCERGLEVSPVRGWQALNAGEDEKTGPREARRVASGPGSVRLDLDGVLAATKTFNEQIRQGTSTRLAVPRSSSAPTSLLAPRSRMSRPQPHPLRFQPRNAPNHHVIPSSKERVFGALRYVKVFQKKCRFAPHPFDV
jgi:hypothetical protein